ncbi:TPA: hypothetical protein J6O31_002936 [Escherichia coli]|uniref:hypothetical protein n=1 Tax=Escherichia coli TaxID=562 RepID=UPI000AB0DA44|nr:hypothetical protein [Escherichia coli]EEX4920932.1 hypothetical protein [Escherichia albertii]EFH5366515.1 hypothetical protein [Escherichia coli]EFJ2285692.1 hypothetical protein [Escherichia albertii]EFT2988459.1 hypothetical protein [Escherichia coli]EGF4744530.1 hypothetical protein [Escherichia coli]
MDLSNLMTAIGVKKHAFELAPGFTVYIRLPAISKYSECSDPYTTIHYCVVDANGKQLFKSPEQVESEIDMVYQIKLNTEITRIFTEAMNIEEIEKK